MCEILNMKGFIEVEKKNLYKPLYLEHISIGKCNVVKKCSMFIVFFFLLPYKI